MSDHSGTNGIMRAVILGVIALAAVLGIVLMITGMLLSGQGVWPGGRHKAETPAERQRARDAETVVYARYGSLWRYDGKKTEQITRFVYDTDREQAARYLVDWVAFTADEQTVYFIDMDEDAEGRLFRQKNGSDVNPEKVASDILSYAVYGQDVLYLKEGGSLYMNGERLLTDVAELYAISDNADRILVADEDNRLFLVDTAQPEEKERIDCDVVYADAVTNDLERFFYVTSDDLLYMYDSQKGGALLGDQIAWPYTGESPKGDGLFYTRMAKDGDRLYYYNPDADAQIDLMLSEDAYREVLHVGVFPEQKLLFAVVTNMEDETQLLRARIEGASARWELVEGNLEQVPWDIACDEKGHYYYLQGVEDLFTDPGEGYFDPELWGLEDDAAAEWYGLPGLTGENYPEGVICRDGVHLGYSACAFFCAGNDLYLIHDMNIANETFSISRLDGKKCRLVAEDVYLFRTLPDGSLITLRDYSARKLSGDLYVTRKGKDRLVDRDVLWFSGAGE